MEYKIISGRTVEIKRSRMPVRKAGEPKPRRAPRVAGNTSERKIKANELSSQRNAARIINTNYMAGSGHIVLKYFSTARPDTYEAAQEDVEKYLRKLKAAYKKAHGCNPRLFWVTANWSPRRNAPAALHHHLIVPADAIELARTMWQGGGLSLEHLDSRADHSELAAYLVANVHDRPGKKKWHCSRNMEEPIYTEPVPVDDVEGIKAEPGSVIKEYTATEDEDNERVIAAYLRCVLPAAPVKRGSKITMPKATRPETRGRERGKA